MQNGLWINLWVECYKLSSNKTEMSFISLEDSYILRKTVAFASHHLGETSTFNIDHNYPDAVKSKLSDQLKCYVLDL